MLPFPTTTFNCAQQLQRWRTNVQMLVPQTLPQIWLSGSNETLHLDRFLSFNQRKNRFSWNGDVDDLEQFLKARFVMGIEDGDSTSGKLRMSCNGSCAVLKLPRATFNFHLNTKTLQLQGSACGDIRKVLEDIVKNVLASQTSNHGG